MGGFLEIIDGEVTRSDRILGDLMDFARVGPAAESTTDVAKVIDSVTGNVELGDEVQLVRTTEPDLPLVAVDGEQLRRVIFNFVNNANDAMPKGGTITISAKRDGCSVLMGVSDTGIGIPADCISRIFDPLFTTKTKGTGLGLSVCQKILSQINGSIRVQSKVGKGTSFVLRIPSVGSGIPDGEAKVLSY